jgi:glyoxylase-like metal-dependent hydrolase (beta-lactamase superfamily II)
MGDNFFNGFFPFVDLDSGGTVQGMAKDVAMALETFPQDVKIIPGHGALATRAELQKFHRMLVESMATVEAGIKAGKSVEDLQKAGLDEEWKEWGTGFIPTNFWIQTVYDSLKPKG